MVFKRVDVQEAEEEIEGFSYNNASGREERVKIFSNSEIVIYVPDYESVNFYINDIPKLILALQAAYDHVKGKK